MAACSYCRKAERFRSFGFITNSLPSSPAVPPLVHRFGHNTLRHRFGLFLHRSSDCVLRSINGKVILCNEHAHCSRQIDPQAFLPKARKLREQTVDYPTIYEEFTEAHATGWPCVAGERSAGKVAQERT